MASNIVRLPIEINSDNEFMETLNKSMNDYIEWIREFFNIANGRVGTVPNVVHFLAT